MKLLFVTLSLVTAMSPDRATARRTRAMKGRNIYHPKDLVDIVNTVQNLEAHFLNHNVKKVHFLLDGQTY